MFVLLCKYLTVFANRHNVATCGTLLCSHFRQLCVRYFHTYIKSKMCGWPWPQFFCITIIGTRTTIKVNWFLRHQPLLLCAAPRTCVRICGCYVVNFALLYFIIYGPLFKYSYMLDEPHITLKASEELFIPASLKGKTRCTSRRFIYTYWRSFEFYCDRKSSCKIFLTFRSDLKKFFKVLTDCT